MFRAFTKPNVTFQKRRTSIALRLRLGVLLGVVGIYLLAVLFSTSYLKNLNPYQIRYGRQLLQDSSSNEILITSVPEPFEPLSVKSFFKRSTFRNNDTTSSTPTSIDSNTNSPNCTPPAINEFPSDGLTRSQRKHGWLLIHILLACYCFWFLAVICDEYFVMAIEQMCLKLNIKDDVAGATFMAAAVSSPELFINCIGTFITNGDIGLGAIVGSSVFNILAVPACCGIFAGQMIVLDWWPVTRDCLMYCMVVLGLIFIISDGYVMWYEALILVVTYFFYLSAMYWNDVMARKAHKLLSKIRRHTRVRPIRQVNETSPLLGISEKNLITSSSFDTEASSITDSVGSDDSDFADNPWHRGDKYTFTYICRWPIIFLLWITIPDSRLHPKWRLLTFAMCIVWIGMISYLVAYLVTIIGDTLSIPDSVMGLTILAAGMSVPEAVSSVIVTYQGHGAMGISNSIGSNTFDILLCLGLPWFIKAFFVPAIPDQKWVVLNSSGLIYSTMSLLTSLFGLYIAFAANKFRLDWKIGVVCSVMYVIFLVLLSMIELNVFFNINLPICDH